MKLGELRQALQLLIEYLQAFLRDLVRLDIVNADLQVIQAGAVKALDPLRGEQIAVGDQARQHASAANAGDDRVEVRMEQRFAAADRDNRGSKRRQLVDALQHLLGSDRFREAVEFVAVSARKIAAADGNDVCIDRMPCGGQPLDDHAPFAQPPERAAQLASESLLKGHQIS